MKQVETRRTIWRNRDRLIAENQTGAGLQQRQLAGRANLEPRLHAKLGQIIIERQRGDHAHLAAVQIVNRPARTRRRPAEKRRVGNHVSFNSAHMGVGENGDERLERRPKIRTQPPLIPAWIAVADHNEISPQCAGVADFPARINRRRKAIIAAEPVQGEGAGVELAVGSRAHQPVGMGFEQRFSGAERNDFNAPQRLVIARLGEIRRHLRAQFVERADGIGLLRARPERAAQNRQPGQKHLDAKPLHKFSQARI